MVEALLADLRERGHDVDRPEDPLRDATFLALLNDTHPLPQPML